jgi:hypothetical protein
MKAPSVIGYSVCSIKDAPLHTQAAFLNKTKTVDMNHPPVVERKQTELQSSASIQKVGVSSILSTSPGIGCLFYKHWVNSIAVQVNSNLIVV